MKGKSKKIFGTADRPRLSVYISLSNIYAQIIDDVSARTIVSASTLDKDFKSMKKAADKEKTGGNNISAAKMVGEVLGKRASAKGVSAVVFDRGSRKYHGRVKALADSARAAGLKF